MARATSVPTLGSVLHHDWTRRCFAHLPDQPAWAEHLDAAFVRPSTTIELAARSLEGLEGTLVAARHPRPAPGDRRFLLWHGKDRLVEETLAGWFGPRVQRLRSSSCRLLLERLGSFAILDPASDPTYVLPLGEFAALGASHGVLEQLLDARVLVASEAIYARAGHLPSLRVYVGYDGARYGDGGRKLFYNAEGAPVVVESVARDVLQRLAYDAVHPAVFHRFFHALVGRPASHFSPGVWPAAFVKGRVGPLEWADRARRKLLEARDAGMREALLAALTEAGQRAPVRGVPAREGPVPLVARYLSRDRFSSLLDCLGDRRLHTILEGLLFGYEATAADWFAWEPGGSRAFFCEIKSRGDHLRGTQKSTILWCQRGGLIDYRLLEVLHERPERAARPAAAAPASALIESQSLPLRES